MPSLTQPAASLLALLLMGAACNEDEPPSQPTPDAPSATTPGASPAAPDAPPPPSAPDMSAAPSAGGGSGSEASNLPGTALAPAADDVPTAAAPAAAAADAGTPDSGAPSSGPRPLDLLFVVDNSISMADKQALLGQVADVLSRFIHPLCVDAAGNQFPAPADGAACAAGQRPQFDPVTDVHLGVISTSLGDGGANVACPATADFPRFVAERADNAHLIGALPRGSGAGANQAGFVAWHAGDDEAAATSAFASLVASAGENGCGWEMSLEAWYRFLADPFPAAALDRVPCPGSTSTAANCVQPAVDAENRILLDDTVLAQRAAFLRPNSRLGVVMLTDENDCSLQIGNQSWVVLAIDDARPFFRGSSVCADNPNDPCCYSCPLGAPAGCTADPVCAADPAAGTLENRLPAEQDGQNLRCFQQKRRFGVDFLYPIARYVNALTQPTLCALEPDLASGSCADPVVNPLFADGRDPADVFLAGIIGVPTQLIVAEADAPGRPAVASGLRYKLAAELSDADWAAMVGDSSANPPIVPTSPFMVESQLARDGVASGNPINGREYATTGIGSDTPDDLEYACILPLPEPRDCAQLDPAVSTCDCFDGANDTPLCEQQPGQSAAGTLQYWGKAYPGTRQLEVLRALGQRAVVGSICATNTSDPAAADFSYRPSIAALVDSMEARLRTP